MYVEAYLPISINQAFTYHVPRELENQIYKGSIIQVPFGSRRSLAYVNKVVSKTLYPGKTKTIISIKSNIVEQNPELGTLVEWMSRYYITSKGTVAKNNFSFLYSKTSSKKIKTDKQIHLTKKGKDLFNNREVKGKSRIKVLEYLFNKGTKNLKELKEILRVSPQTIKTLERDNLISVQETTIENNPLLYVQTDKKKDNLLLSEKQDEIFQAIKAQAKQNKFSANLIHGVTGSGKTEIYIKLIENLIKQRKSALILVPEIVLTPETATRFKRYFQKDVGVWNSSMTYSEKKWTWDNVKNNKIKIIVGTRSSVFLPMQKLSLIVVDEEHDSSYKQAEGMPSYNARDIAIIRAKHLDIPVVLGSATPSIESYYNCTMGKYNMYELKERYGSAIYPEVELVNMFDEVDQDQIFSQKMLENISDRMGKNEQVILLHNRRGFSSIMCCLNCGYILTSLKTSTPLTYHKTFNQMLCHHTDEKYPVPKNCRECGSSNLQLKGVGTQQIEDEINKFFPQARVSRFDADSTAKKNSYKKILNDFENHKYDILIGTQMVSKGFDFHNVTLVGVLNADIGLFAPDFRSGERIFQLLYQVCGRAGRGNKKGKAIIQSFNTRDPYIQASSIMDTKRYYNTLLAERFELNYPPFSKVIRILLKGKNMNEVQKAMNYVTDFLNENKFSYLGPSLAPIEKINNFYRYHLIIKSDKPFKFQDTFINDSKLNDLLLKLKRIRYQIDIDAMSLL